MSTPPPSPEPSPNPPDSEPAVDGDMADYDDDDEEDFSQLDPEEEPDEGEEEPERVPSTPLLVRVHDVFIRGNSKTVDSVILAEIESPLRSAKTIDELFRGAGLALAGLHALGIFDSAHITLDPGPPELPDTANVVVEVVEAKNPLSGNVGMFSKPQARSWTLEGSLKWKNIFGYGDIWDASGAYGWDQSTEISVGVTLPRLKRIANPVRARLALLSNDWLKFSSYKERLLALSLGLISTQNHDLSYNFTWRTLSDPSSMASTSVRRQLGHSLLSSLKYTYNLDTRNSSWRPTSGYAFMSSSQIGGLGPDSKSLRYIRQEFDLRYAIPLGFYHSALNFGVSAGLVFPWGKGFMDRPSPLPERFFLGGNSSPVGSLGGPLTLLGFKCRGLGPSEARRLIFDRSNEEPIADPGRDALGGDFAVTAFADLSFDLPLKLFRETGIHGHAFAGTGNLAKLTENEFRNFSVRKFAESFRHSCGVGLVVPTNFFRMEINYCYILKQFEHDRGKTGIQFSFSAS